MADANPWLARAVSAQEYHARIEAQAAAALAEGRSPHGEAERALAYEPSTAIDAGCGTGRIARHLHDSGVEVIGVDLDPGMLAIAERENPAVEWVQADLTEVNLGRTVDLVIAGGNVMVFLTPGTLPVVLQRLVAHLVPGGALVAGWSLDGGPGGNPLELPTYDQAAAAAGLRLHERFATWEGEPYDGGRYAVSVHCTSG